MQTISYPSLRELTKLEANGFLEGDGISINLGKEPMAIATLQVITKRYQEGNLDTTVSGVGTIVDEIDTLSRNIITKKLTTETCTLIGDTTMKNSAGNEVYFKMLKFPYKILEDVSRNFQIQQQPSSQENVNKLINSTGFYFSVTNGLI